MLTESSPPQLVSVRNRNANTKKMAKDLGINVFIKAKIIRVKIITAVRHDIYYNGSSEVTRLNRMYQQLRSTDTQNCAFLRHQVVFLNKIVRPRKYVS